MSTPTRTQRRAARLDDPQFESLRTPRMRRRLVAALAGLLVVEGALCLLAERAPVVFVVGLSIVMIAFVLLLGALKASTRGVEELPADALDERQWQVRGEVYARAYWIGFGLLTVELAVAAVWLTAGWAAPGAGVVLGALLLTFHISLVLPTMVAAATRRI
ncbi:hypothetical protein GCM10023328_20310 [Modestobacter marinus]|uniref:Uncharacterized protein n=1 Tax=Modestobacter marinus TaxID=477641 RepID=A0A846LJY1_9ACTN|nr:hypothetical protein [Modestobacter marinus]NIH65615.1 hypothetical protein [Modestobacter marinus]GGL65809.1 hypothetical protein GCM10011589_22520 [Modestobacter marinus]